MTDTDETESSLTRFSITRTTRAKVRCRLTTPATSSRAVATSGRIRCVPRTNSSCCTSNGPRGLDWHTHAPSREGRPCLDGAARSSLKRADGGDWSPGEPREFVYLLIGTPRRGGVRPVTRDWSQPPDSVGRLELLDGAAPYQTTTGRLHCGSPGSVTTSVTRSRYWRMRGALVGCWSSSVPLNPTVLGPDSAVAIGRAARTSCQCVRQRPRRPAGIAVAISVGSGRRGLFSNSAGPSARTKRRAVSTAASNAAHSLPEPSIGASGRSGATHSSPARVRRTVVHPAYGRVVAEPASGRRLRERPPTRCESEANTTVVGDGAAILPRAHERS